MEHWWHTTRYDATVTFDRLPHSRLPKPAERVQIARDSHHVGADLAHHLVLALDGLEGKVLEQRAVQDALGQGARDEVVAHAPERTGVEAGHVRCVAYQLVLDELEALEARRLDGDERRDCPVGGGWGELCPGEEGR